MPSVTPSLGGLAAASAPCLRSKSRTWVWRVAAVFACAASLLTTDGAIARTTNSGWELVQKNGEFGLINVLIIDDKAARVYFPSRKVTILTKAPGWEVFVFNDREKMIFKTNLDNWLKTGITYTSDINREYFSKGYDKKKIYLLNQNCICATASTPGSPAPPILFRTAALNKTEKKFSHVSTVSSQDIPVNQNISKFLRGVYRFPPVDGVPVAIFYIAPSGSRVYSHTTISVHKTDKVEEKRFAIPTGYKQVATPDMAIGGAAVETFFEEMLPK